MRWHFYLISTETLSFFISVTLSFVFLANFHDVLYFLNLSLLWYSFVKKPVLFVYSLTLSNVWVVGNKVGGHFNCQRLVYFAIFELYTVKLLYLSNVMYVYLMLDENRNMNRYMLYIAVLFVV